MSPQNTISLKDPAKLLPATNRAPAWKRRIFSGIFTAMVLLMLCGSALALPPSPSSGAGAGHFNQGIPVYWPYHVLLMSAGFILFIAGVIVARFRKTGNWYKTHMIIEGCGGACIIAGLFIGVYMVALSGLPHLRNIHEILGMTIGILVIITIPLGYFIKRANESKKVIRMSHRWLGRIIVGLMGINILLGLLFLSILLHLQIP